MEGDGTSSGGGGGCAGSGGNSRWSPTKDQISMLENLYKQGVRTPSAEQIQQITTRLRGFGHIEGKNVFYWFQNHKARQRQKQKQESFDYFNRFLHRTIPAAHHHHHHHVFPPCHPLPSNVVSGTYYQPQNDIELYQQCPKVLLPSCINKRSSPVFTGSAGFREAVPSSYGFEIAPMHTADNITSSNCGRSSSNHQETLALFPMHPTGILQGRNSTGNSSGSTEECSGGQGQPGFFDFFSAGPGSFVSD